MHYLEAPASTCVELLREAQELGRSRPTFGAVRGYLNADFGYFGFVFVYASYFALCSLFIFPGFVKVRIIVSSEDCDRRYFSGWSSHTVEVNNQKLL